MLFLSRVTGGGRLGRENVEKCINASLKNLGVDYIDLFQCHRYDVETPMIQTLEVMSRMVESGKIKMWGVSRWTTHQISNSLKLAASSKLLKPVTTQHFYNIFNREIEGDLDKFCLREGVGLITYSPLAQGVLTGKYFSERPVPGTRSAEIDRRKIMWDLTGERIQQVNRLRFIAEELGISMANLSLLWCLKNPAISSVIFGASTIDQVEKNIAAIKYDLSSEDYLRVNSIIEGVGSEEYKI